MIDYKLVHSTGHSFGRQVARPYIMKQYSYGKQRISYKSNRTLANWLQLTIVSSLIIFLVFMTVSFYVNSKERIELVEVTVSSGDTLWSIAKTHYKADGDIREFIYSIQKLNKLTTAQIYPGQVILLPLME